MFRGVSRKSKAEKSQKRRTKIDVRYLVRSDLAEVLRIERDSFEQRWTEADFLHCLRQRNCLGMVSEAEGQVVGFMLFGLHKTHLHILNFAVAPEFCRQGVGSQMIGQLIGKLSQQRRENITLEIRETNSPGLAFFKSLDFLAVGVLQNHYEDTPEDAYRLQYSLRSGHKYSPRNRISKYFTSQEASDES